MSKKTITLDDLAAMVQRGFNEVDARFKEITKRLDRLPTRKELLDYATLQQRIARVREYLNTHFDAHV